MNLELANEILSHRAHDGSKTKLGRQRKIGVRGSPNRRILATHVVDGVEYSFHATKGWRAKSAAK